MDLVGMYMLNTPEYSEEKIEEALEMLYADRKNEFRELSEALLEEKKLSKMSNWRQFVLNFCLDVIVCFTTLPSIHASHSRMASPSAHAALNTTQANKNQYDDQPS